MTEYWAEKIGVSYGRISIRGQKDKMGKLLIKGKPKKKFCYGFQWHPETLRKGKEEQNRIFEQLVKAASN